jgi:hypothetical protein
MRMLLWSGSSSLVLDLGEHYAVAVPPVRDAAREVLDGRMWRVATG